MKIYLPAPVPICNLRNHEITRFGPVHGQSHDREGLSRFDGEHALLYLKEVNEVSESRQSAYSSHT
jgi:hypothetical protein